MSISDEEMIRRILEGAKTIAIVGASVKSWRDSNSVMQYLMQVGYKVIPVNPKYGEVLGQECYPALADIKESVDIVDVFRRSDAVSGIADEAIVIGAGTLWMQVGVVNEKVAAKAEAAGLNVIMDRCIKVDHQRLLG